MDANETNSSASSGPGAPPDFETALARLEAIVYELEEGRIGLAEALARYEEGVKLLRQCFGLLETAERRIELLTGVDAAGNPVVEAYDATASADRAEQPGARSRQRSAGAKPVKPRAAEPSPTNSPPTEAPASESRPADAPSSEASASEAAASKSPATDPPFNTHSPATPPLQSERPARSASPRQTGCDPDAPPGPPKMDAPGRLF